jgi:NDP-sugar pyrophosphorylase family protein
MDTATTPILNETPAVAVLQPPAPELKVKRTRKKRAPKHDFKDGRGRVFAHKHDNGGGWVENTAKVDDAVYVGARCEVFQQAQVLNTVRLEGRVKISGFARVRDAAVLKHNAEVCGRAKIGDAAKIYDNSRVGGHARIGGASEMHGTCRVFGNANIFESTLRDKVSVGGDCHVVNSGLHGVGANGIQVGDLAAIVRTSIYGAGTIERSAQLHQARVQTSQHMSFLFSDFAIVLGDARIYAPLQVKDHVVIIGGTYSNSRHDQMPPTIDGNRVLHQGTFRSYDELLQFLNATGRFTAPGTAGAAATAMDPAHILRTIANGQQVIAPNTQIAVVLPGGPRRILRAPEPAETV